MGRTAMPKLSWFIVAAALFALALGREVETLQDSLEMTGETAITTKEATCSNPAKAGDKMTMDYTGTIDPNSETGTKGLKFDSSLDRGTPFSFTLGEGQVIQGWDQGLVGICPGENRKLVIPPALGYGAEGAGADIPGGATLDFDVTCIKVNNEEAYTE